MSASSGLSTAEVLRRRELGQVNNSPTGTGRSLSGILRTNVFTLFNAVAGGCFVLLLILGAWQDALFGVFVIAATVIAVWATGHILPEVSTAELRTAAFVALGVTGLWVLSLLARPFTVATTLTLVAASTGLVAVLAVPVSRDFLDLGSPTWGAVAPALVASLVAGIALEIAFRARFSPASGSRRRIEGT